MLLATFLLTVFRDLTEGIVVGFSLGALLFTLQSMARFARVLRGEPGEDETLRVGQDAKAEAS